MKTLFIQTHELAKKLDPNKYTCHQLEYILRDASMHWWDAYHNSCIIMEMLFKEQKEFRKFDASGFRVLENIFDVQKYEDVVISSDNRTCFSNLELKKIRQRLINSLLTRPDRTLCLISE